MGSADRPGKMDENLKSENMQKRGFLNGGGGGVKAGVEIFFALGGKGALTPYPKSC